MYQYRGDGHLVWIHSCRDVPSFFIKRCTSCGAVPNDYVVSDKIICDTNSCVEVYPCDFEKSMRCRIYGFKRRIFSENRMNYDRRPGDDNRVLSVILVSVLRRRDHTAQGVPQNLSTVVFFPNINVDDVKFAKAIVGPTYNERILCAFIGCTKAFRWWFTGLEKLDNNIHTSVSVNDVLTFRIQRTVVLYTDRLMTRKQVLNFNRGVFCNKKKMQADEASMRVQVLIRAYHSGTPLFYRGQQDTDWSSIGNMKSTSGVARGSVLGVKTPIILDRIYVKIICFTILSAIREREESKTKKLSSER